MQQRSNYTFSGTTAPAYQAPAFSSQELVSLCEHLSGCTKSGHFDAIRNVAERVHGFAAARLMTSCAVVAFLGWIVLTPV